MKNVAGGGGRWLDVSPERFPGWIASFAVRHGPGAADAGEDPGDLLTVTPGGDYVTFTAPDGAMAVCHPPFPPPGGFGAVAGQAGPDSAESADSAGTVAEAITGHACRPRTVGVLLVRLGGYAAGVFTGYPPALADAKTGSRLVHGRSAAGGWSQHRFARRREKQASEALRAAADAAVMVFGRWPGTLPAPARKSALDAVILGGDRRAMAGLRGDARLAPYFALAAERFLTVPDPKRAVLEAAPKLFLAVRVRLTGPAG